MNSIQELAQWVIDNRCPKSANQKISNLQMFHTIIDAATKLTRSTEKEFCKRCDCIDLEDKTSVCKVCGTHYPF